MIKSTKILTEESILPTESLSSRVFFAGAAAVEIAADFNDSVDYCRPYLYENVQYDLNDLAATNLIICQTWMRINFRRSRQDQTIKGQILNAIQVKTRKGLGYYNSSYRKEIIPLLDHFMKLSEDNVPRKILEKTGYFYPAKIKLNTMKLKGVYSDPVNKYAWNPETATFAWKVLPV